VRAGGVERGWDVLRFVIKRLIISIPILFLASMLVFVLVVKAGDPLEDLRLRPGVTKAEIAQRSHQLGLDKTLPQRYVTWITHFVRGDFGLSIDNQPVRPEVFRALSVTLRLVLLAQVLAVVLGILVGIVSAVRQYTAFDYAATGVSFLFYAIPTFCVGVLLKEYGALKINDFLEARGHSRIIKTIGDSTPNFCTPSHPQNCTFGAQLLDKFGHYLLPTLTLMLISYAGYSRYQRASMLETLNSDYVRTARAKGLRERRVIMRHAFRNALIPIATIIALDFGAVFGGAIITERIFGWQGMGTLFVNSLTKIDPNTLLAFMMVTAMAIIFFNLMADIVYAYLDPRIRLG